MPCSFDLLQTTCGWRSLGYSLDRASHWENCGLFWSLSTATWHLLLLGPIVPIVPLNKPNSSLEIASPTDILGLHMRAATKLDGTGNPLISKILVALVKVVSSSLLVLVASCNIIISTCPYSQTFSSFSLPSDNYNSIILPLLSKSLHFSILLRLTLAVYFTLLCRVLDRMLKPTSQIRSYLRELLS